MKQLRKGKFKTFSVQGVRLILRQGYSVFEAARPSIFLAEKLRVKNGERVCDVGTGCGLYAIIAAKLGAKFSYGIDISEDSIELSRENARLNNVSDVCVFLRGNLFKPVNKNKFEVVITNPPQTPWSYLKKGNNDMVEGIRLALDGGRMGGELAIQLISESSFHLVKGGRLYILIIKWRYWKNIVKEMEKYFSKVNQIAHECVSSSDLSPTFLNSAIYSPKINDDWFKEGLTVAIYEAIK